MNQRIERAGNQLSSLVSQLCSDQAAGLEQLAKRLAHLFADGGQLLTAGTGVFQCVAQMTATQFAYHLDFERPTLPAISLGSDVVLSAVMMSAGDYDQLLLRHYRALAGGNQLLLLFADGQPNPALARLCDEVLKQGQPVVLVSAIGSDDKLYSDKMDLCLNLKATSKARQIEMMQFVGHLLCELVEAELFQR